MSSRALPDRVEADGAVRAVDRAIAILQAFTPGHPTLSVLELQAATGLSRPTLYRLLRTLAARGLVRAEGERQRFALGPGVMALAQAWMGGLDVVHLARPLVAALRDASGETAALFLLRGDRRLCALEFASRHVLAMTRGLGETEHIGRGASGKAILAFAGPDAAPQALPPEVDAACLARSLAETRRTGIAISRGEVFRGAVAIAAPVLDHAGQAIGSVAIYGPEARLGEEEVRRGMVAVRDTAGRLSAALGHRGGSGAG